MDESEIPIDIHTSKLLDWLISRRNVPRDWNKKVLTVREKINEAIKDMPEDKTITDLLLGSYISYYQCQKIVEILKDTEGNSKNLFGQYSSKRIKDWLEIIKLYEKENIYLGEVASILQRNVNYEVPALKKQIQRSINLLNEYDKKENNYEKQADATLRDFNATCKSLGIKGVKIKKELVEKAAEFPQMCEKIVVEINKLKPSMHFYQEVVKSLVDAKKPVLGMLQYIIDNGNTVVYQWKYKKVPTSIEAESLTVEEEEEEKENTNDDVIDFGDDGGEINYDDDIDWGISTVEEENPEKTTSKESSKNIHSKNVARGEEARTLLGHPETRNLLLNDIMELEAFLKGRQYEMNADVDGMSISLVPESMQLYDIKTVTDMLDKVQTVKNNLTDSTSLHFLSITTNQKYLDELVNKLKQKLATRDKFLASIECIKTQRAEAINESNLVKGQVDLLIRKSKELQELIEQDISKRYKGRPVNLIAGANLF